jgi:hypothetical protein
MVGEGALQLQPALHGNGEASRSGVDAKLDLVGTVARGVKGASLPLVRLWAFGGAGLDAGTSAMDIKVARDCQLPGNTPVEIVAQAGLVKTAGAGAAP